jgi:hypothetical protein
MLKKHPITIPRTLCLVEYDYALPGWRLGTDEIVPQERTKVLDELAPGLATAERVLKDLYQRTVPGDENGRQL